ncbi:MAG: hypothetical protein ACOY9D_01210 [Pseudomonadota bacterium]
MSDAGAYSNRGDDYQRAIALKWAVDMLADNDIVSMEVEVTSLGPGNKAVTVDDIVVRYQNETHYFQCKKNQPDWREWKLSDETMRDELLKVYKQLQADTTGQVHFYSQSPFGALSKLKEYAEIRPDHTSLTEGASQENIATLKILAALWKVSEAKVLTDWRRLKFITTEDVDQIKRDARLRLQQLVNQPDFAIDFLTVYIVDKSGKRTGPCHRFTRQDLLDYLHERGIVRIPSMSEQEILHDFRRASAIHRDWKRQIGTHRFPRSAVNEVLQHITSGARTILVVDKPGSGKTCVLLDVVDSLEQQGSCGLLFIKGDYYADCPSPEAMVAKGLPDDVAGKVALLADYRQTVVVIDSLDVLSLNRQHGALGFFLGMLDQVGTIKNATCVVACREYDLSYDYHLSGRDWQIKLPIGLLNWNDEVLPVLAEWGVNAESCSEAMRQLLQNPRNLAIYERVALAGNSKVFTSEQDLLNIYLDEVVRRDPLLGETAMSALQAMAACLLRERGQWLPAGRIKMSDEIRRQLLSVGVLISGQSGEIGFGHQTLAEGLAVMAAMSEGRTFADFILGQPSLPFVRPAVRAFFFALRAQDARHFRKEVRQVLDDSRIAFHLRRLVAESLGEVLPEADDWTLIRHLFHTQEHLFDRFLWNTKSADWLNFLITNWLPLLRSAPSQHGLKLMEVAGRWLAEKPVDVIRLWRDALDNGWVDAASARWRMVFALEKLSDWQVEGVAELMKVLLVIPTVQERDFLGKPLSRWVEATGNGDDLLWQFIASDVTQEALKNYRLDRKLQCDPHVFYKEDFLRRRMQASTKLLDLALHDVEYWSKQQSSGSRSRHSRYDGFLYYTSWERRHSQHNTHHSDGLNVLMDALEAAFLFHATNGTEWWYAHEPLLRQTGEGAVLYFLLQAYQKNPQANLDGISKAILDPELWRGSAFEDELPLVARAAYYYLDDNTQERHQQLLLHLWDDEKNENNESPPWVLHSKM